MQLDLPVLNIDTKTQNSIENNILQQNKIKMVS